MFFYQNQQQVNYVWLPYGTLELKKAVIETSPDNFEEIVESFVMVFPNPSDGNFTIRYNIPDQSGEYKLIMTSADGKIIDKWMLNNEKGDLSINCSTCITGNYILSLYIDNNLYNSYELSIKK